jgi:iron complex transport system substrate-binding protein
MKRLKFMALMLALIMALALISGCASTQTATPTAQATSTPLAATATPASTKVTVTDMADREIELDAPADKIVALTASDCEILYAIGAGETLVGRGEYCDYPEEIASIPAVQSGSETNIEQIIALAPQVVIMSTMAQTVEQVSALEKAGIKVVVSDAQDIEGVYEAITLIGAIAGKNDEAQTVITTMKDKFEAIKAKVTVNSGKTIYFEVSPLEYGLWAAGGGTFMDEIATMLGLTNAFADVDQWGEISEEQVIQRDPDYIITIAMYYGEGPTPVEEITDRSGWDDLKAVKNEAVFNLDSNEASRPGPRLADAAATLYKLIYGE